MNTLDYILKRFDLEWLGCVCGDPPYRHEHEVLSCFDCACPRYERRGPVDIPNFGRDQLGAFFAELGFKTGAEIGVKRGEFSESLCKGHPELHLYCVDAWTAYDGYRPNRQQGMDQYFAEASARLKPYNCSLIRHFSTEAAKLFENETLDFVYIDAAHDFINVVNDLGAWIPKVKRGGIVAGHDYRQGGMGPTVFGKANTTFHVKEAVDAFTLAYRIDPYFILGRKEIVEGEIRDKIRSFMWVKE